MADTMQDFETLMKKVTIEFKNPLSKESLEEALFSVAMEQKYGLDLTISSTKKYDPNAPMNRMDLNESEGTFHHFPPIDSRTASSSFDLHSDYFGNVSLYTSLQFGTRDYRVEGISDKEIQFIDSIREEIYDHFGWDTE